MLALPQLAPLLPAKVKSAVKRAEELQPEKLIVTWMVRLPPAAMLPPPLRSAGKVGEVKL